MSEGGGVKAETDKEKTCFQLIQELYRRKSRRCNNKKYIHNEIWSLISFKDTPS